MSNCPAAPNPNPNPNPNPIPNHEQGLSCCEPNVVCVMHVASATRVCVTSATAGGPKDRWDKDAYAPHVGNRYMTVGYKMKDSYMKRYDTLSTFLS